MHNLPILQQIIEQEHTLERRAIRRGYFIIGLWGAVIALMIITSIL